MQFLCNAQQRDGNILSNFSTQCGPTKLSPESDGLRIWSFKKVSEFLINVKQPPPFCYGGIPGMHGKPGSPGVPGRDGRDGRDNDKGDQVS